MKKAAFLLLLMFVGFACKKEGKTNDLIPQKTFKNILVDLYIADGYYMMNYGRILHHNDSANYYKEAVNKYGYTLANFDSTLKYYSTKPKELDAMYDDVITELNKLQQEASVLQQYEMDSSRNLFKKKKEWNLPKDGPREMIPFIVPVKDTGMYTIVVQFRIYNDDQAQNPHLTAYFYYNDTIKKKEHREYFPEISYKKGERLTVVTTHKRNSSKKNKFIKGFILNHDNKTLNFKKHVQIKNIIVVKD